MERALIRITDKLLREKSRKEEEIEDLEEELSDWKISMKIEKDQSTVTRTRQKIAEDIARWEEWYKRY